MRNPMNNQGFTMLEVLVALLVISFGLLGLVGLQTVGLQYTHSASLRTTATQLAYDMADRMRANQAGVKAGYYNNPTSPSETPACLQDAGCSAQQMAETDVAIWKQELARVLPQGDGVVCIDGTAWNAAALPGAPDCDNAAGAPYVIKVWWDDKQRDTAGALVLQQVVTSFQP